MVLSVKNFEVMLRFCGGEVFCFSLSFCFYHQGLMQNLGFFSEVIEEIFLFTKHFNFCAFNLLNEIFEKIESLCELLMRGTV